jgi:hypothetical protein
VVTSVPIEDCTPPLTLYCCTRVNVVVASWSPLSGAQVVAVQLSIALAAAGLQIATTVGPIVAVLQVVAVQPLVESAMALVHEAAGVGPVRLVPGHVVVVKPLAALGPLATHEEAPTGPTTMTGQVVVV